MRCKHENLVYVGTSRARNTDIYKCLGCGKKIAKDAKLEGDKQ